ncbi:MAG: cyclic nucleotide-binding domain-containing protein [Bryobacteraceae bacterium]
MAALVRQRRRLSLAWGFALCAALIWGIGRVTGAGWATLAAAGLGLCALLHIAVALLFDVALRRLSLPGIAGDLALGMGYAAITLGVLARGGADVTGIIATSTVLTAIIGFALQGMLADMLGGVALQLERSILEGDWLKTELGVGRVRSVRIRHTAVETPDGDTILIPNTVLTKSPVMVLGRTATYDDGVVRHRKLITFSMNFHHSPPDVIAAVEQALASSPIEGVHEQPKPACHVVEYTPESVQYGVHVWLSRPGMEYLDTSSVRQRIYYALQRLGTPLATIAHVVGLQPAPAAMQPFDAPSALRGLDLFRVLSEEEAGALAVASRRLSFAPGEAILRQGDAGTSLYLVLAGRAQVVLSGSGNQAETLAALDPGEFFGEMSLLTGEPRSASVVALDAVECCVIDKPAVVELLRARPELASEFAAVLERRQTGLAAAREKLDAASADRQASTRSDLLSRIQRYFGIGAARTQSPR